MRKNPKSFAVAAAAALSIGAGAAAAPSTGDAVQWRVEDGGNGHWYRLDSVLRSWTVARSHAESVGGHLATITTPAENAFVKSFVYTLGTFSDTWLGAVKSTPASSWTWITGESWGIPAGQSTSFDGVGFDAQSPLFLEQAIRDGVVLQWADESNSANIGNLSAIEWSADCNSDGIVDFGQIRAGELDDANANNVPDCCEGGQSCDPCSADITGNGNVDAADLAAVLSAWGGTPTGKANADVDGDGSVNGADLAIVLGSWGPCP